MPDNRRMKGSRDISPWLSLIAAGMGGSTTATPNSNFGLDQETANAMQGGRAVDTSNPWQKARLRDMILGNNANELNQQYTTAQLLGKLQNDLQLQQKKALLPLEEESQKRMTDYSAQSANKSHRKQLKQGEKSATRKKVEEQVDTGEALLNSGAGLPEQFRGLSTAQIGNALQKLPALLGQLEAAGKAQFAETIGSVSGRRTMTEEGQKLNDVQYAGQVNDDLRPYTTAQKVNEARLASRLSENDLNNLPLMQQVQEAQLKNQLLRSQFVPQSGGNLDAKGNFFQVPSVGYEQMTPYQTESMRLRQEQLQAKDPATILRALQGLPPANTTAIPTQTPHRKYLGMRNGVPVYGPAD